LGFKGSSWLIYRNNSGTWVIYMMFNLFGWGIIAVFVTLSLPFVITKWRMQLGDGKIREIIAELSRINKELKMERVHIFDFRILCVCTINSVMQEIIANYM